MKKIIYSITLTILLLTSSFVNVLASQEYPNKKGSIIINAISEGTAITGIEYNIYKIADIDNDKFEFNVVDEYKSIAKNLQYSNTNQENDWNKWLEKFSDHIIKNSIVANETGSTVDGILEFSDLPVGLYLVSGQKTKINIEGKYYYFTPQKTFVAIPNISEGQYVYNIEVNNKLDKTEAPYIDIEVVKVFKDSGYETKRPESIEIELYKNNVVEGNSYILNQDNDFSYKFENLDNDFEWDVKEKEVDGYQVSYDVETIDNYNNEETHRKKYIKITNTYVVPPNPKDDPELPNTGVLWWPVPILLTVGIASMVIGHMRNKNEA